LEISEGLESAAVRGEVLVEYDVCMQAAEKRGWRLKYLSMARMRKPGRKLGIGLGEEMIHQRNLIKSHRSFRLASAYDLRPTDSDLSQM
jgi:hypothetical protein